MFFLMISLFDILQQISSRKRGASLSDNDTFIVYKRILGYLQIDPRRTSSYAAGRIEVRAVTRTEETARYDTGVRNSYASQMRTDTQHNQPFRPLCPIVVRFRIAQL